MSEDEIMEVKYISGIQPFMDEEGETVLAVCGFSALYEDEAHHNEDCRLTRDGRTLL